jgi:trigger factor
MQVTIDRQDDGRVALSIEVDAQAMDRAVARVYHQYGRRLSVPGFRKGKVPQAILERYLSPEDAAEEAIEDLAGEGFRQAVEEHRLSPVGRATLEKSDRRDDGSVVITAVVPVRPEVVLGPYKGLKAAKTVAEVTDEHVAAELDKLRGRHAEYRQVEDRGVEAGDLAIVDATLLIDGQPHEQGSATGYPLEVGSDTLFPELNESLIGAGVGEERRVPVTYPADFHRPDLAGKSGEFVVTVRQIKRRELPELTDDFVRRHTSVPSADELRQRIRNTLEAVAEAMAESNLRSSLVDQVVAGSQVEVPAPMVEREAGRHQAALERELDEQGATLDAYLSRRGLSEAAWRRSLEVEARGDVRRALVVDALGDAERLEPAEAEIDAEIALLAREEGRSPEQTRRRLERAGELDRIINRVYHRKVMEFLVQAAEITTEQAAEAPDQPAPEE